MKVPTTPEIKVDTDEDTEPKYVDFSDGSVALRELKAAFREHAKKPHGGRLGGGRFDGQQTKPTEEGKRGANHRVREKTSYGHTGGPSKFCFERCQKILGLLSMGLYLKEVRAAVGIGEETFSTWLKKGREQGSGAYYVFARAVEQVSAMVEARHLGNIHRAAFAKDSGTSAKERAELALRFLEKRFPKRWGNRVDITSDDQALGAAEQRPTDIVLKFVTAATATPADETAAHVGKLLDDEA